jgi:hypothetical protein
LSQVIGSIDKLKLGIYLAQYSPEMADSFKELTILRNSNREVDTTNKVGLFILVTLGISIFNLILLIIQAIGMNSLAHRPLPTMVQLVNGKTIEVTSFEGKNRSPQLIKDFTLDTLRKLFTWRQHLPLTATDDPRHPQVDPGVPVESKSGKLLIPTTVWGGSFGLADRFREEFLGSSIAPLMTQLQVLQGRSEVAFIPLDIQDPVEIKGDANERLWKVNLVANLVYRATSDSIEKVVPFNKTIYLRSVIPPSLVDVDVAAAKDSKNLARVVAMARSSGIEIYAIEKTDAQDTKPILPNAVPVTPTTSPASATPGVFSTPPQQPK